MTADKPGEVNSGEIVFGISYEGLFSDDRCRDSRERISHAVLRSGFWWKLA
jgi:hypothetical protein